MEIFTPKSDPWRWWEVSARAHLLRPENVRPVIWEANQRATAADITESVIDYITFLLEVNHDN